MRVGKDGDTLSGQVFEALRAQVFSGKLGAGQRLKVAALAATHGVSLNVVREALNRLAGESLVDVVPQQGFTVRGLSAADLVDLVHQRIVFESIALRDCIAQGSLDWQSEVLAAHHRLDKTPLTADGDPNELNPLWLSRHDEFHRVMLQACGSPRLFQMIRQMAGAAELYHRALLPVVARDQEMEDEHRQLLEAILASDAERAVQVLTAHLEKTRDKMLPLIADAAPLRAAA